MPDTNTHDTASTPEGTSSSPSLESHVKPISWERLVQGFPLYFKTVQEIVLRPTKFVAGLDVKSEEQFWNGIEFVSYSIVISFALLVPTFIAHKEKISKLTFFARLLVQYAIYGMLMHFALKLMGSRTVRLKGTATAYAYIVGLGTPMFIVLSYPLMLMFGPRAIFGTSADVREMSLVLSKQIGLLVYTDLTLFAFSIYALVLIIKFFSMSHMISKFRVVLAVFMVGGVMTFVQIWVINPLFNYAFAWVDKMADYL
jgi:hypothetical protein